MAAGSSKAKVSQRLYLALTSLGPKVRHQCDPQTNSVAMTHGRVSASPHTHAR
jgi:hypothetical protein